MENTVYEYELVSGYSNEFISDFNGLIKDGYEPFGNLVITPNKDIPNIHIHLVRRLETVG